MSASRREHSGMLILRVWTEGVQRGVLRIRITRVVDRRESPVTTVTTSEEACTIVRAWLEEVLRADQGGGTAAPHH